MNETVQNVFLKLLLGINLKANYRRKYGIYLKDKKLKFIKYLTIILFCQTIVAQQNFVTVGEEILTSNSSITFTIGQTFYQETKISPESVKLNVGVQIPYSAYVFINPSREKFQIIAYPNPAIDIVTVDVKDYNNERLSVFVSSMDGKSMESKIITQKETIINIENWPSGMYIFKIVGWGVEKNFKIIKGYDNEI